MNESVFEIPKPAMHDGQLLDIARRHFGIEGDVVTHLASERDQNARIGDHVLKVANGAEDAATLALQEAALRHLAAVAPDLALPRVAEPGIVQVGDHRVRAVTWIDGMPYAEAAQTPALRRSLGSFMGRLSAALQGFGHPGAHRPDFLWSLGQVQDVRPWVADIAPCDGHDDAALAEAVLARHERHVQPRAAALRAAVVHQDANDWNVLTRPGADEVCGLIDFGDMAWGRQIDELAVTLAYALLDVPDIVAAAGDVIGGYCAAFPLQDAELAVLWELVAARLAMSLAISSHRSREFPENDYLTISQAPVRRLLRRIVAMKPDFLHFAARAAAGREPVPQSAAITGWLATAAPSSLLAFDLRRAGRIVVSLADGAPLASISDPVAAWDWLQTEMTAHDAEVALGRYDEDRSCYAGDQFRTDAPEPRSVHIGVDVFVDVDTPVRAMLSGTIETVVDNATPYDYGPTVIVRHLTGDGTPFWVLYGHLSRATLVAVAPGQAVAAGDTVGFVGDHTVNGGWAPHVHVQLMTDLLLARWGDADALPDGNFEGAGEPSRVAVWRSLVPDADLIIRLGADTWADHATDEPATLEPRRRADLGASLSTSYRRHLSIVRGEGQWLVDHTGRRFLDCVNNVAHVGHSHPHVVGAIARQAAVLNTNTRYLHRAILDYAERLAALFPDPLSVVYLTNSGSEANELALRIARTATGRRDIVAMDWGYHGNTNNLVEISAYKFNRRGGTGRPANTHIADLPDPYRGAYGDDGAAYAESVAAALARADHEHGGAAAFIAESISGCGGQVVLAPGYLPAAFAHARAAGAVTIADEVQVGFGRVGRHMWAFELQGVVPDIVTLGKPIGNGHPLGAVVTTPALAAAFANGMEWFNTFGGNPVSCAAGMAVLDVVEGEHLTRRALVTGSHLLDRLRSLAARHETIGDVRGEGLYIGADLVVDRGTKVPATALAGDVVNLLRDRGILVSTDGPHDNVLKIKPPLVFGISDADLLADALDAALGELA